ncbi:MAG: DNA polymerase III subunit gamma and tau [Aurantimicrobium sp.]|nr:DNA polymerase III subunit gamma and tau [Aurantimicrobium sp.]
MTTALYRRYRPETFAEMIGQSQVTDPLMTALRTDRVNHAYLFSGPRGCGKTTSARILARCLNCAEGPTDTPCGKCASCIELARDGSGSLDVVEIDAASHNGVDDARDLRERAAFAPARDRFKIFILDEAHMVTPQGFNALLKLVEEPPEHVKFIFATTEPEKVIGTIRSRTHHYPFRLIPTSTMLEYVEEMCRLEGVTVDAGVLPLVVRAGGGSARDTLSLLDQLIAGSEGSTVSYERAVALLGFTHGALLDEVVEALAARDAGAAFASVDRVIQTGQDPRRFVEDLLERLRDLIVVAATGSNAVHVLRGTTAEEVDRMEKQARVFGSRELSHAADIANAGLTEMIGATSPKLHLELMVARLLVEAGAGVGASAGFDTATSLPTQPAAKTASSASPIQPAAKTASPTQPADKAASPPAQPATKANPIEPTTAGLTKAWPAVLEHLQNANRMAWIVVTTASVREYDGDVITLVFPSENDAASFRPQQGVPGGVHEKLRESIIAVTGESPKFRVSVEGTPTAAIDTVPPEKPSPVVVPDAPGDDWAVVDIPGADEASTSSADDNSSSASEVPTSSTGDSSGDDGRYGESVVRDLLGATLLKEERTGPIETVPPADTGAQVLPDAGEA